MIGYNNRSSKHQLFSFSEFLNFRFYRSKLPFYCKENSSDYFDSIIDCGLFF
jgi:hypothetical protein